MNMNRRMFFKSMGAATVAAAPISSALANVVSPKKWDQTCEVLVIGRRRRRIICRCFG